MFAHLLVPLDGSQLAEAALPAAGLLADRLGARVTLLHLIETNAPAQVHGDRHLRDIDEAAHYLREVASRSFAPAVAVEIHVHTAGVGVVARGILDHAAEFGCDLVVMCAHGRGGLRQWVVGSIAQQVVTAGATPVLLIPAPDGAPVGAAFTCRTIAVPLDSDPAHGRALAPAGDLASACAAAIHLIMVVPTVATLPANEAFVGRLLPLTAAAMLEQEEESAVERLRVQLDDLRQRGVSAGGTIYRGDPAAVILEAATQAKADVIALGTHGPAGLGAFWEGSVSRKVANRSRLPLLLVPVGPDDGA